MSTPTTGAPAPKPTPPATPPPETPPAGDPPAQDAPPATPAAEADPPGAEHLKDPGKQALDRMKAAKTEAEKQAKETAARLATTEAELAKLQGREAEHQATLKQREVEQAALAKANERIVKAEIRAAAAGKLADPADALRYLDPTTFDVGNDGEVDSSAIATQIEALVKERPYLAAQGGTGPVFESPGSHRNGDPKGQLTKADVERMTPDAINTARAEGRLNDLLGIKT